jgi:hypothetical protein
MYRLARSAVVAVLVVVAVAWVIFLVTAPQPSAPLTMVTPTPLASPEPSVTATPTPTPTPTPAPSPVIKIGPPSAPVSLAVVKGGTIIDSQIIGGNVIIQGSISEYTNEMVANNHGVVTPAKLNDIAWWSGGGEPGVTPANTPPRPVPSNPNEKVAPRFTTYAYGHSWIKDAIFNLLRTLEPGPSVMLQVTTADGHQYAYQLISSFHVAKTQLGNDPRVNEDVVNRFVTISCYRPDGYPANQGTVDNMVGIWQMTTVLARPWSVSASVNPQQKIGVNTSAVVGAR